MNPKEKAEELVDRFYNEVRYMQRSKECALIAVDEVLKAIPEASDYDSRYNHELVYWQLVKEEIEKL
jgi:hypothetical protein